MQINLGTNSVVSLPNKLKEGLIEIKNSPKNK